MDSKGRATAADIPDRDFLTIVREAGSGAAARIFDCFKVPRKVVRAKAAKLAKRGLLEVTADGAPRWVTDRGHAALTQGAKS